MASKKNQNTLCTYRETLDGVERERYDEKLKIIGGKDPYEIEKRMWTDDVKLFPTVTYFDIMNYLIFSTSPYTMEDLKNYKSLEAYNQFVCGWVREKKVCVVEGRCDICVLSARVLHSQRLTAKPLKPWIIVERNGKLLSAHCDCMAGLGEACTHVAALLFSVEATVRIRDSQTVTGEKAYWLIPGGTNSEKYSEVCEINFASAKTLKTDLDASISSPLASCEKAKRKTGKNVQVATHDDLHEFCSMLSLTGNKSALLSGCPPFSDSYVPKSTADNLPPVLTDLFDETYYKMPYGELIEHCISMKIVVSKEQAAAVENLTQGQTQSKLWFRFRAGRITASRMKSVCHTDPANPSTSLVRVICNPESAKFTSSATSWGCEHENVAREKFVEEMKKLHENFTIKNSGLIINPKYPHIGASSDGLVNCDCCGAACLEVKYPFCKKNEKLTESFDKTFCLQKDDNGSVKLKHTHPYHYQVQTQLAVTQLEMAYFVVWTEVDMHMEIIKFDSVFWDEISEKASNFFSTAILPELMGKFYSRPTTSHTQSSLKSTDATACGSTHVNISNDVFCYCREVESGDMVCCDNQNCEIKWFHFECLKLSKPPKTKKWYCPDCRKLPEFKRSRKQNLK